MEAPEVVVPRCTVVVLPEVPPEESYSRLAALAQYSVNAVVAIGHDCVRVVSADLVDFHEPQAVCRYLNVLKHAHGIAGVNRSAVAEFRGFAATLPAQGLPGPRIRPWDHYAAELWDHLIQPALTDVESGSP